MIVFITKILYNQLGDIFSIIPSNINIYKYTRKLSKKINTLYDFKIKDAMLEFVLFYCKLFSMYFGSLQFPSVYAVALCTICKLARCIIHNIRRGRNRMVVVFTTTYAISTNHH
jgi:hypothetical protein